MRGALVIVPTGQAGTPLQTFQAHRLFPRKGQPFTRTTILGSRG